MTFEEAESMTDAELFKQKRAVMVTFHPDRWVADTEKKRAEKIFNRAQGSTKPKTVIKSSKQSFEIGDVDIVGDVADVYLTDHYVIKVSRSREGNEMLTREAEHLKKLHDGKQSLNYFPFLVDSFTRNDKNKTVVNVFTGNNDYVPFSRIANVDPVHAAWMFNRLIEGLARSHSLGIIHGAVVPKHVLVNPLTHMVHIVGWGHSTTDVLKSAPSGYADWYPKYVKEKKKARHGLDVVFAAKTILTMPKVDGRMKKFLEGCTHEDEAWQIHGEFKDLLYSIYGPPKFVPLVI